jgi:UDP-3-O-[3-hydroxymyristoyl] glucosamine N-acyltransferase
LYYLLINLEMKVKKILSEIKLIEFIGNLETEICEASHFEDHDLNLSKIIWLSDQNINKISTLKYTNVICSEHVKTKTYSDTLNLLIVQNPRSEFKKVIDLIYPQKEFEHFISTSAIIHPNVKIVYPVYIGHNTVIEEGCEIGHNVHIGHNNVVKNSFIESNVKIGNNCTIGEIGFGYIKNSNNDYEAIQHVGGVCIKKNCEIGNNVCIDRAVLGNTVLCENVKIDNLVHIAHGVHIGKNSLVIANAMIAGSVEIGENVWIAPSASIKNKVKIGENSIIGLGAVVIKDVQANTTVIGNPARKLIK